MDRRNGQKSGDRRKRRLRRRSIERRRLSSVVRRAKEQARSELSKVPGGWTYHDFAEKFPLDSFLVEDSQQIERVDARTLSVEEFRTRFESGRGKPAILLHAQDSWLANQRWTIDRLAEKYRNQLFKVGEDDDCVSVKLKFKHYVEYMNSTKDDSPLYIFDSRFGEHKKKKRLLEDYEIPPFFQDDLLRYAGERKRPPHRWIVIGPPRSGTGIHIDPLGTSAWNALVVGCKRWALIPPGAPRDLVKPKKTEGWRNRGEAIAWFQYVYPRTLSAEWPAEYKPIHFVQHPGETVFVPSGWWHVVLNLDTTVAITQNFASPANFSIVFAHAVRSRPILARKWLKALEVVRPEIADVAKIIASDPKAASNQFPAGYESDSSSSSSSSSSYLSSIDSSSDSSWTSRSSSSSSSSGSHSRSRSIRASNASSSKSRPIYRSSSRSRQSYRSRSRSPIRSAGSSTARSYHHQQRQAVVGNGR